MIWFYKYKVIFLKDNPKDYWSKEMILNKEACDQINSGKIYIYINPQLRNIFNWF